MLQVMWPYFPPGPGCSKGGGLYPLHIIFQSVPLSKLLSLYFLLGLVLGRVERPMAPTHGVGQVRQDVFLKLKGY